jgi:hypothetical protein
VPSDVVIGWTWTRVLLAPAAVVVVRDLALKVAAMTAVAAAAAAVGRWEGGAGLGHNRAEARGRQLRAHVWLLPHFCRLLNATAALLLLLLLKQQLLLLLFPLPDLVLVPLVGERLAADGAAEQDPVPSRHLPAKQALPAIRKKCSKL